MYEPLKITAYPRTGIEGNIYLPLDGVLYALTVREQLGPQEVTLPGQVTDINVERETVPLQIAKMDGHWFYAASFAQWGPHVDYQSFWVKRFDSQHADVVDFQGKRGRVIVEQGRYKSYHRETYLRHALHVCWYVVGDRERIEHLLHHATHIGKKAAQGNGRIARWKVEPWPHDWSIYGEDGRLMRAIPNPGGVLYGIRPSYWLAQNQTRCQLPD